MFQRYNWNFRVNLFSVFLKSVEYQYFKTLYITILWKTVKENRDFWKKYSSFILYNFDLKKSGYKIRSRRRRAQI